MRCGDSGCAAGTHLFFLSLSLSPPGPIMLLAGSGRTCKSGFGWVPGPRVGGARSPLVGQHAQSHRGCPQRTRAARCAATAAAGAVLDGSPGQHAGAVAANPCADSACRAVPVLCAPRLPCYAPGSFLAAWALAPVVTLAPSAPARSRTAWPRAAMVCHCPWAPCMALQLIAASAGSKLPAAMPGKACCTLSSCCSPALDPPGAGGQPSPWSLGSGVALEGGCARPCAHTCCRPQEPVQRAEDAHGREAQRGDRQEVPGRQASPAEHAGASPQPERG